MHLGFLTPEYPHLRTNAAAGIGTSIKNMAESLTLKGIKVSIFIYGQKEDEVFEENGIKFHLVKQRRFKLLGWYLYRKFLQNYLNKFILKEQIDAIEAPDWTGITAFMKIRCPLVIRMNGSDAYFCHLESRQQKRKNFWFEKNALLGANHLLSVSKFTADKTKEIFGLKKEIEVIPNSVNTTIFKPLPGRIESNMILYFGSIIRKKGVLELAAIFNIVHKNIPKAELVFAGKDVIDKKTSLSTKEIIEEKLSPEARKKVTFLNEIPYEEVLSLVNRAGVVVLPSFAEALPMTWLEAMALEKTLVSSDIGWAKEVMIHGETGFAVDPKQHKVYAEKIVEVLKNDELRLTMGKAARKRVNEIFSAEVVASQNIQFYRRILGYGS
ncbi:glycosyltransferase family 4 protein [uncultured Christiangramia sp.]|uniref:glycosyltransferase family 4 protein n=1 Tax=Christiangramia sp. 3-2217-3z TaxID=3417564 RepID=UPI00262B0D70|nr:glycosyltransferase family 4 protein [uncultured Christiangramia sp.]